jgi:transposase
VSKRERRSFSAQEKAQILKEHLFEGKPVSQVCEEHRIQPTVFHRWKLQAAENLAIAFDKRDDNQIESKWEKKAVKLERKLQEKNEVISELMAEHIALKKSLGED